MVADDWRTFVRPPSGCQNISFSKFVSMKRESLIPFMSYLNLYVRDSIIPRFKYLFGPSRILIVVVDWTIVLFSWNPFQLRTIYTKFNVRFLYFFEFLYESLEVATGEALATSKRM